VSAVLVPFAPLRVSPLIRDFWVRQKILQFYSHAASGDAHLSQRQEGRIDHAGRSARHSAM
jgi:hypothetical protein